MEIQDRLTVVKAIARYQKSWTSCSFHNFGSLYYAGDLGMDKDTQKPLYTDCHGNAVKNSRFVIGPSTGRDFSDDDRMSIELDRGPCKKLPCLKSSACSTNIDQRANTRRI